MTKTILREMRARWKQFFVLFGMQHVYISLPPRGWGSLLGAWENHFPSIVKNMTDEPTPSAISSGQVEGWLWIRWEWNPCTICGHVGWNAQKLGDCPEMNVVLNILSSQKNWACEAQDSFITKLVGCIILRFVSLVLPVAAWHGFPKKNMKKPVACMPQSTPPFKPSQIHFLPKRCPLYQDENINNRWCHLCQDKNRHFLLHVKLQLAIW